MQFSMVEQRYGASGTASVHRTLDLTFTCQERQCGLMVKGTASRLVPPLTRCEALTILLLDSLTLLGW